MLWGLEANEERERQSQSLLLTLQVESFIGFLYTDLFENVICAIVQRGHSRDVAECTLKQLCSTGYEIVDCELAVKRVEEEIEKRGHTTMELKEQGEECECEQHKREVRDRLFKVVSISSTVDVLNGLRKWVSIVPPSDVLFLQRFHS